MKKKENLTNDKPTPNELSSKPTSVDPTLVESGKLPYQDKFEESMLTKGHKPKMLRRSSIGYSYHIIQAEYTAYLASVLGKKPIIKKETPINDDSD